MKSTNDLNTTVASGLAERYTGLATQVRELAAPLRDEQFWRKPFAFGNSFGHLVLHLTGNLNYYIGAQIAGTGYVRDRDREFTESKHPSKQEALKRFDDAVRMVVKTIHAQSEKDWSTPYTALREEDAGNRFNIFLRCASHLHLHIGHMIYLSYELSRENKPSAVTRSR
jgi:hypothetical protein